eukprot:CFRG0923T1
MSSETIVFSTDKHVYCVPANSVMLRRKHENDGFAVRFLRDGKSTGLGHPYEVQTESFEVYSSLANAMASSSFNRIPPPDVDADVQEGINHVSVQTD